MVPENMTDQIKLFLVIKPHHCIRSIISVKISCRINIWNVNISTKQIKMKMEWLDDIKQNVKKDINQLITTNKIYHLLVMTTIQQFPEQSNILGRKRVIPSRQTPSPYYTIKLFSGVNFFSFYPQTCVGRDTFKRQVGC